MTFSAGLVNARFFSHFPGFFVFGGEVRAREGEREREMKERDLSKVFGLLLFDVGEFRCVCVASLPRNQGIKFIKFLLSPPPPSFPSISSFPLSLSLGWPGKLQRGRRAQDQPGRQRQHR